MSFVPSAGGLSAISSVGSIASGVGNIISAQNAKAVGNYNAGISLQQAQAQKQSFDLTLLQDQIAADDTIAQQQASYAKSGVKFEGTPVDVMVNSLTHENLNLAIAKYNNDIKVQSYENQAALERYTASQTAAKDYGQGALSLLGAGLNLMKEIGSPAQGSTTSYTFGSNDQLPDFSPLTLTGQ